MQDTKEILSDLKQGVEDWRNDREAMHKRLDEVETRFERMSLEPHPLAPMRHGMGPFLDLKSAVTPYFGLDGHGDYRPDNVRLGALIAGLVGGRPVLEAMNGDERKAFSELTDAAGDVLVPEAIGSLFIDAVRPATRVLQAGAMTYPMEAPTVVLPGWDTPPAAYWRGELQDDTSAGGSFRGVSLTALGLGSFADLSWEILEDSASNLPGVASIIERELGRAIAGGIDLAALVGSGVTEPVGLLHTPGITPVHLNDVPGDYDFLLDQIYAVAANNFTANAAIYGARTAKTLGKLKSGISVTDKTQLQPPEEVRALSRLISNQVPNDLGTNGDESLSFVGDFSQLVIGARPDMTVRVLRDPYSGSLKHMTRIYCWTRIAIGVLNPAAFAITDQIKAA